MDIYFHSEEIDFSYPSQQEMKNVLDKLVTDQNRQMGTLNVIFCSDEYLLKMNRDYLNHDYYTDIITFNYNEANFISGDLFISIDRVNENAVSLGVESMHELSRVIIHGVLHLVGFNDKLEQEKAEMTLQEDLYLNKLQQS